MATRKTRKRSTTPDPERSARAKAAHEARRQRQEEEQREADAADAAKYRELMASQAGASDQVVRPDNVHEMPAAAAPDESVTVPIVEVPLGTTLDRTPSQKPEEVKDKEHQAALAQAAQAAQEERVAFPQVPQDDPAVADITVHFVEDGFTALGKTFYRGETLNIKRGSEAFQKTVGRDGKSWLDDDAERQVERRGKLFYLPGPFPKTNSEVPTDEEEAAALVSSDPDDLLRIQKRKARAAAAEAAKSPLLART